MQIDKKNVYVNLNLNYYFKSNNSKYLNYS